MNIDVTQLTEEQLTALALIDAEAANQERARRLAYASISDFLTELFQAGLDLAGVMVQIKGTQAALAVKESNILNVIDRGMAYARNNNLAFDGPVLRAITVKKFPRKVEENTGAEG